MNNSVIIMFDFETGSRNAYKTQPIQLAAVAIHPRKMEIIHDSCFNSLIKPYDDAKAIELGLDPLEDEALKINGKTREELALAPEPKIVWKRFCEYVNSFNYKQQKWMAPIPAGFNNNNFDDIIINRLAGSDPYNFGPWDKTWNRNCLFHPIHNIDLMKIVWNWTEMNPDVRSISMDSLRTWMGISKDNAHDALNDVVVCGEMLLKFLKLHRHYVKNVVFENSFKKEDNDRINNICQGK